jgi:hypothetical protein
LSIRQDGAPQKGRLRLEVVSLRKRNSLRHPSESRGREPEAPSFFRFWIPACAGMTRGRLSARDQQTPAPYFARNSEAARLRQAARS